MILTPEPPCSLGLSAIRQQYYYLRTNQPPTTSQQYFSLRTNQHQPSATSQTNEQGGVCSHTWLGVSAEKWAVGHQLVHATLPMDQQGKGSGREVQQDRSIGSSAAA
jgi:hypothetical protein